MISYWWPAFEVDGSNLFSSYLSRTTSRPSSREDMEMMLTSRFGEIRETRSSTSLSPAAGVNENSRQLPCFTGQAHQGLGASKGYVQCPRGSSSCQFPGMCEQRRLVLHSLDTGPDVLNAKDPLCAVSSELFVRVALMVRTAQLMWDCLLSVHRVRSPACI